MHGSRMILGLKRYLEQSSPASPLTQTQKLRGRFATAKPIGGQGEVCHFERSSHIDTRDDDFEPDGGVDDQFFGTNQAKEFETWQRGGEGAGFLRADRRSEF